LEHDSLSCILARDNFSYAERSMEIVFVAMHAPCMHFLLVSTSGRYPYILLTE
jgi:hypothetical protein